MLSVVRQFISVIDYSISVDFVILIAGKAIYGFIN